MSLTATAPVPVCPLYIYNLSGCPGQPGQYATKSQVDQTIVGVYYVCMDDDWRMLPLDTDLPSCGNRKDLPKKQRVHPRPLIDLGRDVRNAGEKGYIEFDIEVCRVCGRDFKRSIRDID